MLISEHAHVHDRGLRERNKLAKLALIERAARDLFVKKGYDATTTREIARRAGIGAGTFFRYFREKRDVLLHLLRGAVLAVGREAFAALPSDARLVDQLMHVFARYFTYYQRNVRLSRVFVKELMFLEAERRAELVELSLGTVGQLAALVERAQARGEVAPDVDPLQAASDLYSLYSIALITWLCGIVQTRAEQEIRLRGSFERFMRGLAGPAGRKHGLPLEARRLASPPRTPRRKNRSSRPLPR